MAWNPSFSFKLRDDEITFGTLIFDKNCADMLCQELLRIKQGGQVSIDVIREILDKGCFTDTELDNARAELEDIKQDIFEFKQMLTSRQRFEAWYDTTASAGAYIIGSQSWYQHYMSLKMTAADMYFKLVSSGEQFNQQAKDAYEKRYGEILRESSAKERTELALRRQFDKNVANGVSNAREIYCEAMVVAGLMSEKQVEAQNKLFKAAGSSEVESTIKESTKELPVSKLIEQLWLEVESHSDMMHKALAIERFVGHLDKIFYNVDLPVNIRKMEEATTNFFVTKTIDAGELYTKALSFKKYLDNGKLSESIKNTYIKIEQDKIDEMLQSLQNIKSMGTSVDLEEEIEPRTAESLIDLFKKTEDISDVMERALIIADIAKIAIKTLRYAEIACAGFWEESIEEFLKGTGPAETMIELAEVFTVVLSFKSNSNIINSCALEYKDGEYTALLRRINEAQVYFTASGPSEFESNKDIVINADTILQLYDEVFTISDAMKKALIISDLATGTIKILKAIEVPCSSLWDKSIEDFLAGNGSAGTMIELAEELRNVLSIEAHKNIINTYNLNDRDINYTKLTRQIEEAKG